MTIDNAVSNAGTAATVSVAVDGKICGILFNSGAITLTATATVCSFTIPFRVGVHFDGSEAIGAAPTSDGDNYSATENAQQPPATTSNGAGVGYNGFWLAYWQNTC